MVHHESLKESLAHYAWVDNVAVQASEQVWHQEQNQGHRQLQWWGPLLSDGTGKRQWQP